MERRYILKFALFVVEVVIKLVVEHFFGSCGSKVRGKRFEECVWQLNIRTQLIA